MNAYLFRVISAGAMLALSLGSSLPARAAPLVPPPPVTVIVRPTAMNNWFFYNDEPCCEMIDNSLGSFVAGPGAPAAGVGSAQISVIGSQRRNLATYQFSNTLLSAITVLKYRTYNPSIGNGGPTNSSAYLNFNVSFDGNDTWQRRLIFLPNDNGTVTQNTWKEWDAVNGGAALWRYSGANWPALIGDPGTTPKTWTQILTAYPLAKIRATDAFFGIRVGEPYPAGYTENIDTFTFGTASGTTLFNFEPSDHTIVVRPGAMQNWFIVDDNGAGAGSGSLVAGPATPPLGAGSGQLNLTSALGGWMFYHVGIHNNTRLADVTQFQYSTYVPTGNSFGGSAAPSLQFEVDYDVTDANTSYQGRMVYEGFTGAVTEGVWQAWDTLTGNGWKLTGAPGNATCTPASYCSWATIVSTWPNIGIHPTRGGLVVKAGSGWGSFQGNFDKIKLAANGLTTTYDFEAGADLTIVPATTLVAVGGAFPIDLVLNGGANVYGYQFQLNYPPAMGTGTGSFVNSLFDTTADASIPGLWNAACAAGACKFASSKTLPGLPITGTGALGHVNFVAGAIPGVYPLTYSSVILSDPDAIPLPVTLQTASVTIYGSGTVAGLVKLQGRATPMNAGVIVLHDVSNTFPDVFGTFNAAGNYAIAVPALAGGTTWRITADHYLYLANQTAGGTDVTVSPGATAAAATTTLRAGDANNSESITVADLSCIGADFGGPPSICGPLPTSSDINNDGTVNILDLVLAGGNYNYVSPRPW